MRALRWIVSASISCLLLAGCIGPAAGGAQVDFGTVEGTVTIRNLAPGFGAGGWVHACLASDDFGPGCEGQVFLPPGADGSFSIELAPGQWHIAPGYREFHPSGPRPVLGDPVLVAVEPGGVTTQDLVVNYQPSGIVQGKVTVTGLPAGMTVTRGVFVCRAEDVFELYCPTWAFDAFFDEGEPYSLSLLPGDWRIAAAYNDGRDVIAPPVDFHLDGGETLTLDLEIAFDPTLGPPPPPPPPVPTLAPPLVPTTASTAPASTVSPPSTAPSVAASPTSTPRLARAGKALAFTGSPTVPLVLVGSVMILIGTMCSVAARRRSRPRAVGDAHGNVEELFWAHLEHEQEVGPDVSLRQ